MRTITAEQYIIAFGDGTPAALEIEPGEEIEAETMDWCFGQVDERSETHARAAQTPRCPAAGPVVVGGASPGDAIAVTIISIQLKSPGWMIMRPGAGPLGHLVNETNVSRIPLANGFAELPGGLRVPVHPMLGVIGTAPAGEPIPTLWAGDHGGNLDTREITAGSTVMLPVFADGALLAFGDVHAAMGDGELSGSGVECGATIRMRVELTHGANLKRPRVLTPQQRITVATQEDVPSAVRLATADMVEWLQQSEGLGFHEAALLVGAAASLRFSHVVNKPGPTVKVVLDRSLCGQANKAGD